MKNINKIKIGAKDLIAKYRDEFIGFILLLLLGNTIFLGVDHRQSKTLQNQGKMLVNDEVAQIQNKIIIDSISVKWKSSYNKLMQNIKEGAEIVEDRMTFIQDFLQKKLNTWQSLKTLINGKDKNSK